MYTVFATQTSVSLKLVQPNSHAHLYKSYNNYHRSSLYIYIHHLNVRCLLSRSHAPHALYNRVNQMMCRCLDESHAGAIYKHTGHRHHI